MEAAAERRWRDGSEAQSGAVILEWGTCCARNRPDRCPPRGPRHASESRRHPARSGQTPPSCLQPWGSPQPIDFRVRNEGSDRSADGQERPRASMPGASFVSIGFACARRPAYSRGAPSAEPSTYGTSSASIPSERRQPIASSCRRCCSYANHCWRTSGKPNSASLNERKGRERLSALASAVRARARVPASRRNPPWS